MQALLPWIIVAVVMLIVLAMPWRRPDPHHTYFLHLLSVLEEKIPAPGSPNESTTEVHTIEHRTAVSSPDNSRGTHL
jgi:hypothetical protein